MMVVVTMRTALVLTAVSLLSACLGGDNDDRSVGIATTATSAVDRRDNTQILSIDQRGFDLALRDLDVMIERARSGDAIGARNAFVGRLHNFTHLLDSEMRARSVDARLQDDLYQAVADIEVNLAIARDPALLARQGERMRELLQRAAVALGYKAG